MGVPQKTLRRCCRVELDSVRRGFVDIALPFEVKGESGMGKETTRQFRVSPRFVSNLVILERERITPARRPHTLQQSSHRTTQRDSLDPNVPS